MTDWLFWWLLILAAMTLSVGLVAGVDRINRRSRVAARRTVVWPPHGIPSRPPGK